MKKIALALAALTLLTAAPVMAQTVKDKKTCLRAVEDAKGAQGDATIGKKTMAEAEDLIRIAEHLCTQGNFVYADTLLQLARGMLASE